REIIEEWKWMGSPVWSRDGIIAVANAHKGKVKLTFDYGARLPDPNKLFNAGLEGNQRRAIDFFEGDEINERALKNLVRAASEYNQGKSKKKEPAGKRAQGREVELAVLRHRGPGLVRWHPCLHALRQGGVLPRRIAATGPARRQQEQGHALHRHP